MVISDVDVDCFSTVFLGRLYFEYMVILRMRTVFSSLAGAQFSPPAIPVRFMSRVKPQKNCFFGQFFYFLRTQDLCQDLAKLSKTKHNQLYLRPFSHLKSLVNLRVTT